MGKLHTRHIFYRWNNVISLRCYCNIILNPKSWKQFMYIDFTGILFKKNKANAWLNFMWIFIINLVENEFYV